MSIVITRAKSDLSTSSSDETEELRIPTLFDDAQYIHILDETNFDEFIYKPHTKWVVTFYAEWCGWSKRFAPELKFASLQLKDIVNIAVVNCAVHRHLKKRFRVNRYPTIFMIDGEGPDHQVAYNGKRTEEDLVAAVFKKFHGTPDDKVDTNKLYDEDANLSSYED